jgi:hypothetical protein
VGATGATGTLSAVSCSSTSDCVAVGNWTITACPYWWCSNPPNQAEAAYTTDGGRSWTTVPGVTPTSSDGRNWSNPAGGILAADSSCTGAGCALSSISCPTTSYCLAIGRADGSNFVTAYATHGGVDWTADPTSPWSSDYSSTLTCATASICLGATRGGRDGGTYRSTDGGRTWAQASLPVQGEYQISCYSATGCVATGSAYFPSESFSYSTDAGQTWHGTPDPPSVVSYDAQQGLSCTTQVCETIDILGNSWRSVP